MKSKAKDSVNYQRNYINEALTKHRSELFFDARKLARDKPVESAWTHDGTILVRDHARVIHRVETYEQLNKLRSNANRSYASVASVKIA